MMLEMALHFMKKDLLSASSNENCSIVAQPPIQKISNPDASMRGMVHLRQGIKQSKGSTV
jgi:hypothetical protein